MKIILSKPEYKLNAADLSKEKKFLRSQFKDGEYWRPIRRRVPFFMDGYRYAAAAVKKRWGIDFVFFEAGQGVMPCYLPKFINTEGAKIWMAKMDKDKKFANQLVKEIIDIVEVEKKLAKSIPRRELSKKEVIGFLMDHLSWWVKYFEIGFLWFGVEEIKEKIDKQIAEQWVGSKKDLKIFLDEVYRPMKLPLSSLEQRDLLKLYSLKGKIFENSLKKHYLKYRHLALHNVDDEYFDIEYYRGRLKLLRSKGEYRKMKIMMDTADKELLRANQLIKKTKLSAVLKERINFVRWFMYIRTETIDHMMLVNGAYKSVFSSLSNFFSLPTDVLLHMTYEEIISSLKKGDLVISRDLIFDRAKNGYAFLITTPPHKSYLVVGKEVEKFHKFVIPHQEHQDIKELKGQTAFKGKIRGVARVIIDRRNSHELKDGEILVTTMTSPEFVPAMKKSAGIITNEGGVLCHAAIMSRELRKPCVIGTKIATDIIKTGQIITLDADSGVVTL
ncbi:MAG: PEP-utilizers protein [Patescibacteria group bacterium]|nr:PEP-utilizers protein [Patescibacteria group bacterium]